MDFSSKLSGIATKTYSRLLLKIFSIAASITGNGVRSSPTLDDSRSTS
jgi:aminopeptidase-like protein